MSDDLRTRIATAIMQSCHGVYMDDAVAAADRLIRELPELQPCPFCSRSPLWQEPNGQPMSDLRTRIAAIIDREVDGLWEPLNVADAVIRELKLTEDAGVIVGCVHD